MTDIVTGSTALAIENATLRADNERLRVACSTAMAQLDEHRIIWAYDTLKAALAQEKQYDR